MPSDHPYVESELRATIRSAFTQPPRRQTQTQQRERRVIAKRASDIRTEMVRWAWQDRAPLGALTMLAGQPGLGKSTFSLGLAASASNGTLDGDLTGNPCATLVVTLEDHLSSVAKPRLLAAKANLDLVSFITVETPEGEDLITLPGDLQEVERRVHEHGAKFLVIDPIVATLSGSLDSHRDQDVRRGLAPLAKLAERCDVAILGVMHLNKSQSTTLLNRVSGSIAWTGAARSVLVFERDPEDPESDRRVIVHAKSNMGPYADTLACRIEQRSGKDATGEPFLSSKIVITGTSSVTAGDLTGGIGDDRSSLDDASAFLKDELANGPKSAKAIRSAAQDAGIAWRTIERAKKPLGIESIRNSAEGWEWRLEEHRQPLGGVALGGLGGLPEKPVNTGDCGDAPGEHRQPRNLAVLGSTHSKPARVADFMRVP